MLMRTFDDSLNQTDSIFNSEVIISPNNCKNYQKKQCLLI